VVIDQLNWIASLVVVVVVDEIITILFSERGGGFGEVTFPQEDGGGV